MMICGFCGEDHSWLYCRKKPEGWKPPKKSQDSSTVERRMRGEGNSASSGNDLGLASHQQIAKGIGSETMRKIEVALDGSTPAPEAKPKRGRPRTGFDKKAYDRIKAAERRAKIKAGK